VGSDFQPDIRLAFALPFFRLALLLIGVVVIDVSQALGIALIYFGFLSWVASVAIGFAAFRSSSGPQPLPEQQHPPREHEKAAPAPNWPSSCRRHEGDAGDQNVLAARDRGQRGAALPRRV
jgi:hypothetical protein